MKLETTAMKPFFNKVASAAAATAVIVIGCAMAGLGLTVLAFLALFGLAAFALAFIASPFMAMTVRNAEAEDDERGRFRQPAKAPLAAD